MKMVGTVSVFLFLALALSAPARALDRSGNERSPGIYVALGVGLSEAVFGCHGVSSSRFPDTRALPSLNIRAGFSFQRRVLFGYEYNGWRKFGKNNASYCQHGLLSTFYPLRQFYFKIGPAIGFASYDCDDCNKQLISSSGTSIGLELGVGTDIRIKRSLHFMPAAQFIIGQSDEFAAGMFSLVLGVGWFW